jgi:hypothetical protein
MGESASDCFHSEHQGSCDITQVSLDKGNVKQKVSMHNCDKLFGEYNFMY